MTEEKAKPIELESAPISDEFFPFASYYDEQTVITKDGDLMQTFCLTCYNNAANVNGDLSSTLRQAILRGLESDDDADYAVWLHTIRSRDSKIDRIIQHDSPLGNEVSIAIQKHWASECLKLNNYSTVVYVTIVRTALDLRFVPKNIPMFFSRSSTTDYVMEALKKFSIKLNKTVSFVIEDLGKKFRVDRLMMRELNGEFYSDHLSFLDQVVNFSKAKYRVPIADLSSVINRSEYHFDFGTMYVKNSHIVKHAQVFTVKDCNKVNSSNVSGLINNLPNVIMCEIFHITNRRAAIAPYKKRISSYRACDREEMIEEFGLTPFDADSSDVMFNHYVGVIVVDVTFAKLENSVKKFIEQASNSGIMVAVEDIGIERAFYSFMPANFKFIRHTHSVPSDEICRFAYSYTFDNDNIKHFHQQSSLFVLPTLNNNPYAFGLLGENPDILLYSSNTRQKTVINNMIISHVVNKINANVYVVETSDNSETFMDMIGGTNHFISLHKDRHDTDITPFAKLGRTEDEYMHFVFNFLYFITRYTTKAVSEIQVNELSKIARAISKHNKSLTLDELKPIIGDASVSKAILRWIDKGADFSHLFNLSPKFGFSEPNTPEREQFFLDAELLRMRTFATPVVYTLLSTIHQKIQNSNLPSIVIIDDPFFLSRNPVVAKLIKSMVEERNKQIWFIFNVTNISQFSDTLLSVEDISSKLDTTIHVPSPSQDDKYAKRFNMPKGELYALQALATKPNTALIKQAGLIVPVHLTFDEIGTVLTNIMCDSIDLRNKINKFRAENKGCSEDSVLQFLHEEEEREQQEMLERVKQASKKTKEEDSAAALKRGRNQEDVDHATDIINSA